jgi:preprotein translocase subunit SecG
MLTFFSVIHVVLCVFMIFVILLQPGKDAGMGAALGGGATQTAFGGRGAVTFLSKVTAVCAIAFFVTSLGLSFVGLRTSVAAGVMAEEAAKAPAPGATPAADAPNDVKQGAPGDTAGKAPADESPKATDAVPAEKATP